MSRLAEKNYALDYSEEEMKSMAEKGTAFEARGIVDAHTSAAYNLKTGAYVLFFDGEPALAVTRDVAEIIAVSLKTLLKATVKPEGETLQ